jgi:predicted DNA-binding transcriptional regulator YafY
MPNAATRLITLIMLLQRQPNRKAADLASKLGVSVRTVHRYVSMLDEIGIPVYSERGPYGGFSLVRGYRMPPLVFTPEEAAALYLGTSLVGEMWGQVYGEAAQGALAKLDNVLPDEQRHEVAWARRSLVVSGMHRADLEQLTPHLEKLRRAIRERRRVSMSYRGRSQPEPLRRDLDPYALVHRWGWWYGVGYCHLRGAMRSFRVDRIVELALLDETFQVADDFDTHAYLATEPHIQPRVQVTLRFAPKAALQALDDRALWHSWEQCPDGSVIVSLAVPNLDSAVRTALGYTPDAVVLEPPELRALLYERAKAMLNQYKPQDDTGRPETPVADRASRQIP